MKNKNKMISALLYATLSTGLLIGATSCNDAQETDSKEVAKDQNDAKFEDKKNEKDANFLVDAATINREEVSLGQLAQQKGKSSSVKKLGKMMEDEHSKSLSDVTALAQRKAITLPGAQTDKEKEAYAKLNEKSDKDFDKDYADMMVKGHKDAISLFEKAEKDCTDADIRAWATATLPVLRTHLEHAEMCQNELDKK
jgi:putative membrane protein